MRGIVGLLVVSGLIFSAGWAGAEDSPKLLGAGVVMAQSPYRGEGARIMPVPLMVWEHKKFYVKGVEAGYHFYKTEDLSLSVMGAPRFMGYHSSDSDDLAGMHDRQMSFDAGLAVHYALPGMKGFLLGGKAVADAGGRHQGQAAEVSLSRKFASRYFQLTPSAGARFQSSQLTGYYYGVRSDEVRAGRAEYEPRGAVNYFADVMFNFGIHPKWIVITRVGVEFLDSEIRKSPLVGEDRLITGIIGLSRRF